MLSVCLPMAFPLTRHTYRTNKYHHQMSPLYTPCHTTTNVFTSPLPTGHFDDHIHSTPCTLRRPYPHYTSQTFTDPWCIYTGER